MRIDKPGVYAMSAEDYHADCCPEPSLSSSIAHVLLSRSPLHAFEMHPKLSPGYEREETTAFDRGTAAHAVLLEGDESRFIVVQADDWRRKSDQGIRAEARAAGKIPLLAYQLDAVREMAAVLKVRLAQHEDPPIPFTGGRSEQTLVWQEEGIWCRARLDWLHADYATIDDLKTVERLIPEQWIRGALYALGHDVQSAFYARGVKAVFGVEALFRFVVQETTPPYEPAVIALDPTALDLANRKVERAIRDWRLCLETGRWPGYPTRTMWAEAPPWVIAGWEAREMMVRTPDDGRPLADQLMGEN